MDQTQRVSVVKIGGQVYGLSVEFLREVLPVPHITKLPNVNKSINGVFNLRGNLQMAIDFLYLLNGERFVVRSENYLAIVSNASFVAGLLVEKVITMIDVPLDKVQLPTRDLPPRYVQLISGIYEDNRFGRVYFIDVEALFTVKEISGYRFN